MSKSIDDDNMPTLCANCGMGEDSAGDLKNCNACKMVKYCNRDCQIAHRPQHKKACKKRAAELHDEKLFKQPPPNEDCPICMLPLPPLYSGSKYKSCCGTIICSGCIYAMLIRDGGVGLCPFCRTPAPDLDEEIVERLKKLGDALAMYNMGCHYYHGRCGLPQNHAKASELWHRAAELGNVKSYYSIGYAYDLGNGVERDKKKAEYYYELAAMGGDIDARHYLGNLEGHAGNQDRALKHWMIAAGSGYSVSLENIKQMFKNGQATKDDYAKALSVYQANLVEINSAQRDQAAAFDDQFKYY